MNKRVMATFTRLWNGNLSYCETEVKQKAHKTAKQVLEYLAEILGLVKGTYEIRSNMAGPAVSGEVTLHTDPPENCSRGYYLQIGQSCMGPGLTILFRTCRDRSDYTGGRNNHFSIARLSSREEMEEFAVFMRQLVER